MTECNNSKEMPLQISCKALPRRMPFKSATMHITVGKYSCFVCFACIHYESHVHIECALVLHTLGRHSTLPFPGSCIISQPHRLECLPYNAGRASDVVLWPKCHMLFVCRQFETALTVCRGENDSCKWLR